MFPADAGLALLMILIALPFSIVFYKWWSWRCGRKIRAWAKQNELDLLHYVERSFFKGPFLGRVPKGHDVYFVTVRDLDGKTREAYVAVGEPDQVQVEWKK